MVSFQLMMIVRSSFVFGLILVVLFNSVVYADFS